MTKKFKKIMSFLLIMVMVFSIMPNMSMQVSAASADKAMMMGTSGIGAWNKDSAPNDLTTTDKIVMGTYSDSPVEWVRLNDDGLMFSICSLGESTFSASNSDYEAYYFDDDSALKSAMEALFKSGLSLTDTEKELIKTTTLEGDSMHSSANKLEAQKFFPLSETEVKNHVGEDTKLAEDTAVPFWWLRSSDFDVTYAFSVWASGYVDFYRVSSFGGVRPAYNLNLESVLFTSAAEGGKTGAEGTTLGEVSGTAPTKWKMTVKDTGHTLTTATTTSKLTAGSTITVNYTGASTGHTLSAMVINKNTNEIMNYGNVVSNLASGTGNISVTLPSGFDNDTHKLVMFTETLNGDNKTDLASEMVEVAKVDNTETDITAFTIASQVGTSTIDTASHTVEVTMPYGTNVAALAPTITLSDGATVNPTSVTSADFTNPVTYTVTAEDGTTEQEWKVTVKTEENDETDITAFTITDQVGTSTINTTEHTVEVTMPYGTNVTALAPTITLSDGATVNPTSVTSADFTNPVTYTVTAEDGTTEQEWKVTVKTKKNDETDITAFTIANQVGTSTIDATTHTVKVTMPYGTNVAALVPTITLSDGATISPTSGTSTNFTNVVTYTVTAEDGTTAQNWTVTVKTKKNDTIDTTSQDSTVTVETKKNGETEITGFKIIGHVGTSIIDTINHTVKVTMPYGINVTALAPTITLSTGATVKPGSGIFIDFTNPVTYTVTAEDGTTQEWTVTVKTEKNDKKNTTTQGLTVTVETVKNDETDITGFIIASQVENSTIDTTNHTVKVTMPYGTDVTALAPTITLSNGATINSLSGIFTDFTNPVTYIVTAEDGTTQEWMVTVEMASKVIYDVIEGDNQEIIAGSDEDVLFRIDAEFEKFVALSLNEVTLDKGIEYEAKSGSVVIMLKGDYVKNLAAGEYKFVAEFTDGKTDLNMKVNEKTVSDTGTDIPQIEENSNIWLYIVLVVLVLLLGGIATVIYKRKKSK